MTVEAIPQTQANNELFFCKYFLATTWEKKNIATEINEPNIADPNLTPNGVSPNIQEK